LRVFPEISMKTLLLSAVATAALALSAPAFAQDHHGGGGGGHPGGGHAAAAHAGGGGHAAAPHVGGGGHVSGGHIGHVSTGSPAAYSHRSGGALHIGTGHTAHVSRQSGGRHSHSNVNVNANIQVGGHVGRGNVGGGRVGGGHGGGGHANFNRHNVTASHHFHYRGGEYRWPGGYHYQRWSFGMTLPSVFWGRDYWIDDYSDYGLGYPPDGCVWVRYGNDALLIDEDSGEILEVVYGQFY
jgi:Ni/Co efflux regulator RcnB